LHNIPPQPAIGPSLPPPTSALAMHVRRTRIDILVDRCGAGCRAERRASCSPSGGHRAARCGSARRRPERYSATATARLRAGAPVPPRSRGSLPSFTSSWARIPSCATQASSTRTGTTSCPRACAWVPVCRRDAAAAWHGYVRTWTPASGGAPSRTCQCTPAGSLARRARSPCCSAGTTRPGPRYGSPAIWTWT
jgi:hypothetical protein